MIKIVIAALMLSHVPFSSHAEETREGTMYKRPYCSCCDGHAAHLRAHGYKVTVLQSDDMSLIKTKYNVAQQYEGCHTILIDGYVVEGHVPAPVIDKLLKERPAIRGISLPGMPEGSPGMGGVKAGPFEIYELSDGTPRVYAAE